MRDKDERAMSPNEIRDELADGLIAQGMARDEAVRYATDRTPGSVNDPAADLRAAKERLGAWLAAKPMRTHWIDSVIGDNAELLRHECFLAVYDEGFDTEAHGSGPTEAAAILAALEKVNA